MAKTTTLAASHLEASEVVGRCVAVEGGEGFDETEGARIEGIIEAWVKGGSRWWWSKEPVVHSMLTRGFRRREVTLLCRPNVNAAGARPFVELEGAPEFVVEAEKRKAELERLTWGTRFDGGPQVEVTVFAAKLENHEGPVQLVARTLSVDAKAYAKKLAPALYERRAELFKVGDGDRADQVSRDWARAASRSEAFAGGAETATISAGVEWVRKQTAAGLSPEKAAPKDKVKLTAKAGRAYVFLDSSGNAKPLVFAARGRGTRLKIDLKSKTSSGVVDLGRLDLNIDDMLRKNAAYPAGWIPLTHGAGQLQLRLFNLDPDALEDPAAGERDDAPLPSASSSAASFPAPQAAPPVQSDDASAAPTDAVSDSQPEPAAVVEPVPVGPSEGKPKPPPPPPKKPSRRRRPSPRTDPQFPPH